MNIPWDMIIEAILKIVEQCLANQTTQETIMASLVNPGFIEMLTLRRELRSRGLRGRRLRASMQAIREELDKPDADVRLRASELYMQAKAAYEDTAAVST